MSIDVTDLRATIVPKSDQLNAEQLLAGPMTVTITEVRVSESAEQPVIVHYENDGIAYPARPTAATATDTIGTTESNIASTRVATAAVALGVSAASPTSATPIQP